MARARAVVGGLILLLIAAPANAAPRSPSYSLDELLAPVVAPLEPASETVGEILAPITEPRGGTLDPLTSPVSEALSPVTDPLLDPVEEVVDPITDPVEEVVDPITDPVEEVVDPITDPGEDVIDPVTDTDPKPAGGGHPSADPPGSATDTQSDPAPPLVDVAGSFEAVAPSPAASLVSSAISLIPTRSLGVVSPTLVQSLLSQILDWLTEIHAGSFLAAPFLGLRVLLRALASAGQGLWIPGLMLTVLAGLMARDRRILGTKTA